MPEMINIRIDGSTTTSFQNLENGPDGPGFYEITVAFRQLTSDEILNRLREKFSVPESAPLAPSEDAGAPERALGCTEYGTHQEHKIWVENPDWPEWREGSTYSTHYPPPQYIWQTCPGQA